MSFVFFLLFLQSIMVAKRIFGLVGFPLAQSFSRKYFLQKFQDIGSADDYLNFEIKDIAHFPEIRKQTANIKGLNVTIPYKVAVIPYLYSLDAAVLAIGAVNTIKWVNDEAVGYNTDYIGFRDSIVPLLQSHHKKALVLGNGGAAKAVKYALQLLNIDYLVVSRNPVKEELNYTAICKTILEEYTLVINTTPLGMYPHVDMSPDIPYHYLDQRHLLYDLVYNPAETAFLKKGKSQGAMIKNGEEMLVIQAETAWKIWND